ncbi:MAG: hypothetical protein HOP19_28945 [Acidobacteria bacterium]|nr:hypothetical protein [Acidobacteriota bacterium]
MRSPPRHEIGRLEFESPHWTAIAAHVVASARTRRKLGARLAGNHDES